MQKNMNHAKKHEFHGINSAPQIDRIMIHKTINPSQNKSKMIVPLAIQYSIEQPFFSTIIGTVSPKK